MIHLLKGKVAIVACSADSVTTSITHLFLQQGASVMLVGSYPDFLEDIPELADQAQWAWLQADLTDPIETRYCVSETLKRFGRIDILFYYPNTEHDTFFSPVGQSSEHALITYTQNTWSQIVDTFPPLRNASSSNIIVVTDATSDSELSQVGEVYCEGHRIRIDLINVKQRYHPKRQQNLMAHKQLTPERIARLSLSVLLREKQEEVEWNEVLGWNSEYLDTSF